VPDTEPNTARRQYRPYNDMKPVASSVSSVEEPDVGNRHVCEGALKFSHGRIL
jgi:hypothetical protein